MFSTPTDHIKVDESCHSGWTVTYLTPYKRFVACTRDSWNTLLWTIMELFANNYGLTHKTNDDTVSTISEVYESQISWPDLTCDQGDSKQRRELNY